MRLSKALLLLGFFSLLRGFEGGVGGRAGKVRDAGRISFRYPGWVGVCRRGLGMDGVLWDGWMDGVCFALFNSSTFFLLLGSSVKIPPEFSLPHIRFGWNLEWKWKFFSS